MKFLVLYVWLLWLDRKENGWWWGWGWFNGCLGVSLMACRLTSKAGRGDQTQAALCVVIDCRRNNINPYKRSFNLAHQHGSLAAISFTQPPGFFTPSSSSSSFIHSSRPSILIPWWSFHYGRCPCDKFWPSSFSAIMPPRTLTRASQFLEGVHFMCLFHFLRGSTVVTDAKSTLKCLALCDVGISTREKAGSANFNVGVKVRTNLFYVPA